MKPDEPRYNKILLSVSGHFLAVVVGLCICAMSGCVEAYFRLAKDSRLPAGLIVPPGLTRADVWVTADYHAFSPTVKFTLRNKKGRKLATATGRIMNSYPLHLKNPPQAPFAYPEYDLVAVNGATEILEQRRAEDLLYVVDDPKIRDQLLAGQGVRYDRASH